MEQEKDLFFYHLSKNSIRNYEQVLKHFYNFVLDRYNCYYKSVYDFYNDMATDKDLNNKIICFADTYKNSNYQVLQMQLLKTFFKKQYNININVDDFMKITKKKTNIHCNKTTLKKDDIEQVLNIFKDRARKATTENKQISNLRYYLILAIAKKTGQRIGDILQLKVKDALKETLYFKQEKTGREVFITNYYKTEIEMFCNKLKLVDDDYLFKTGLTNQPIQYQIVNDTLKKAFLQIGVLDFSCHCLRKYVIEQLLTKQNNPVDIAKITGHKTLQMISYYDTTVSNADKDLIDL